MGMVLSGEKMYKVPQGRLKPKKEPMFGKKPYKGKDKNRKGKKVLSATKKINDEKLKPKATKEPGYIKWFHEVYQPPCFVCGGYMGIEFHHVKEHSVDERIDSIAMALCHNHHHGMELSPHSTPVKFKEVYPMEVQLENAAKMYKKYKDSK